MDYEKKYKGALERARIWQNHLYDTNDKDYANELNYIFPELKESEDERIRNRILLSLEKDLMATKNSGCNTQDLEQCIAWLEKQGSEPNWCHHKVDLSNCSEEYCKAYYDGWNNCNQQHSQCKSEWNDVVKCLINGMKFYYEDNEEATWGTEKFSMKVKDILSWLEKQGNTNDTINRDEFAQGVLRGTAINLITWIDYNAVEGNMCLSNMECKDIEDALVNGDWNKIYAYIKKKLEKQGEQKPTLDFKAKDWYVSKVDGKIYNMTYNPTEKKELKESDNYCRENCKGFQETGKCFADGDCRDKREAERKSAWSGEDETRLQACLDTLQVKSLMGKVDTVMTNWLKSLKDRITWKPSEEQMKALDIAIRCGIQLGTWEETSLKDLFNDLKKLKEE